MPMACISHSYQSDSPFYPLWNGGINRMYHILNGEYGAMNPGYSAMNIMNGTIYKGDGEMN